MKCTLTGELTITAAARARSELLQAIAGQGSFDLDTTGVLELDAAGLQVLLAALKSAASAKIPIGFPPTARGPVVTAGLELLGLNARDWNHEGPNHG
jgi:anti-anti-sigma regulatory factor